jgi:Tfp pilus assembly protein PilE
MTTVQLQTHRFLFSDEVSEILFDFAKLHQYDERKTYKEAWETLLKDEDIATILTNEANKIQENGYDGDVLDKMFKSTRYYYRNKLMKQSKTNDIIKPPRKDYESMPNTILEDVDRHIKQEIALQMSPISQGTNQDTNITLISRAAPGKSFEKYYAEYKTQSITNDDEPIEKEKLKKTYKNRFYKIRVKLMT